MAEYAPRAVLTFKLIHNQTFYSLQIFTTSGKEYMVGWCRRGRTGSIRFYIRNKISLVE